VDQSEFERIAKDIRPKLIAVGGQYGLTAEEAEDIAQDTMLRLWTLRGDAERWRSVEAFAMTVARHLCIDTSKRRRTVGLDGKMLPDNSRSRPDEELQTADDEAWLARRLRQLPPAEYQVLHMRHVEGKSNSDISAMLGVKESSVASMLSRARHRLLEDIKRRNA